MRTIHRERKSRFFCLRSRYAYVSPRSTVSRAWRYVLRRPPTNPLACFMVFLWRRRVFGPPFARGMARLLEVGEQTLDRLLVRLVDQRGLAEPALLLAGLVGQDVAEVAAPPLHLALGGQLEALGRAPARLDLRHRGPPYLAISMIDMLRPSMRACCSTLATSATFSAIRSSIALPSSGCVIERPRKKTDTLTRWPSARKPRMWPTLKLTSCALVCEPTFTSFKMVAADFLRDSCAFFFCA